MYTKERAIEFIKNSRFPTVFVDLFEGRNTPKNFDIIFGVPDELYLSTDTEQKMLIPNGYEPLWDDGNFDSVYCFVAEDKSIRKVYVEGGEVRYKTFLHFSGFVISEVLNLEWNDVIKEYSDSLEFPYFHEIMDFLKNEYEVFDYDSREEELSKYIDDLIKAA